MKKSDTLSKVLAERSKQYGAFIDHSKIAQGLKDIMRATPGWSRLAPDQKESLELIQHKIARILNGDPTYLDSWVDCGGYIRLVTDRLERDAKTQS